jgi:hypothetical protein
MSLDIPGGATHRSTSYGYPQYYKWVIYGYGVESHEPFYGWFWWNGKRWEYDGGVNSDRFEKIENQPPCPAKEWVKENAMKYVPDFSVKK